MERKKVSFTKESGNNDFIAILKKYKKDVSRTEKSSKKFLVELGVITEKGNRKRHYNNLCIQEVQE